MSTKKNPVRTSTRELQQKRLRFLVQFAILLALEAVVCFTPLGSLPIGPMVATLSHIPVIIAAMLLGPVAGAGMGFAFGLFSFLVWTFMPPPTAAAMAFVFTPFHSLAAVEGAYWSLAICFVPRILLGLVCGLLYQAFSHISKMPNALKYTISAIVASLLHSFLVISGIYVFFGPEYIALTGAVYTTLFAAIIASIGINGVVEAVIAGVVGYAVCAPVQKYLAKL